MSQENPANSRVRGRISRRSLIHLTAGLGAAGAAALSLPGCAAMREPEEEAVPRARFKQSIAYWCFEKHWDLAAMCRVANQLGCESVELVEPQHWPLLKEHGLICALHGSHGFEKGMNNPEHHDMCIGKMRDSIDACAEHGFPNVITFTGFREDIPDDEGIKNCVNGYKKVIGYAEKKNVNLCLEMLNSRVDVKMKGHPGYQGDHVDYCMEIIKQVGSPRMKLLFDVYHVQIMDGDIIRRIRQYGDYIGHYHTAGNPGRGELDDRQEINYKPVVEEIARTGYSGYIGHEFVPTGDPLQGLKQAVALCDV